MLTAVDGALAAFVPRRDVPMHKLMPGRERAELCRDVGGPNAKKFYLGWISFIRTAELYDATFFLLGNLPAKPVAIHYNDEKMNNHQVSPGREILCPKSDATLRPPPHPRCCSALPIATPRLSPRSGLTCSPQPTPASAASVHSLGVRRDPRRRRCAGAQ